MENVEYTQLSNEHMEAISSSDTVSLLSLALINTKDRSSQEFDIDPTPRPLCIVKRRSVRTPHALRSSKPPSSPATGDSLPGRSSISTPIPIPRRRSSTAFPRARIFPKEVAVSDSLGSETQSRMSSSSFSTAPSGGCSKGLEDLKVRKQRRKSKSCTTAELVRDINDFYPPPFLLSSSDSEGLSSYSSNHKASSRYTTPPSRIVSVSEDTPKAIPALNRDISVGAFLKAELLNPPIAIDPPKELADQGAFSSNEFADRTAEPDPGRFNVLPRIIGGYDIINDNITQTPRLNRTLNVGPELPPKKKIFSRVLSGFNLLGRSNSIIGIRSGNIQTNRALSVSLRQKGDEAIRSSSETKPPSLKSVSTLVSRPQSTHSVLGGTNATSPRPPESEFTPQTSIDSLATSTTEYTKLRALARPQIAPLFQARLVVTPELESVDTDYSQSFWVAIEVTGDVAIPSLGCSVPVPREIGLDIILLMDLS
ncbi:hypothetical protein FGG08_004059 [Glutinoglossum americanum]|uniref:Uncharacterized protein n=1 Tax=Glutinoglossum americanum TaxID=1670608 RepID=A0A9P8HX31_9PEZI|nr:hypothetical protein FGG08_004059 [Glutinoglossum americanum]